MSQIYLIRSAESCRLGAFEVGDHTASDTHNVIRVSTEVVIPCSSSGPHFVVLQQILVNEDALNYWLLPLGTPSGWPKYSIQAGCLHPVPRIE